MFWLMILMVTTHGIHSLAGMSIIKQESAMQRQMAIMLVTPTVWTFFLLHKGEAHEVFNWKELVGMAMVILGSVWYIQADRSES